MQGKYFVFCKQLIINKELLGTRGGGGGGLGWFEAISCYSNIKCLYFDDALLLGQMAF